MDRMLRLSLCTGLLLTASIAGSQEPALMNGAQALRFQQSPGYYHYVVFCRTAKDYMEHMPPAKLPPESLEYGLCWYVSGTVSRGSTVSPEVDGKLVISPNHVRFLPNNPQLGSAYADLRPEHVELKHDAGQPHALLQGSNLDIRFQFTKLCPTCASGTPTPPGTIAELSDQEFALLDESIRHFSSGWKQIFRLSSGKPASAPSKSSAMAAAASRPPAARESDAAARAAGPAEAHTDRAGAPRPPMAPSADSPSNPRYASSDMAKNSEPVKRTKPVKIPSGAANGLIVKKVNPAYPLEAKLVRLEGTVVVRAVIEKTGDVAEVYALSGPPLLESAAVDAVKQWQYRPYSQNGQPVDVETTIEVVFALDRTHASARAQNVVK